MKRQSPSISSGVTLETNDRLTEALKIQFDSHRITAYISPPIVSQPLIDDQDLVNGLVLFHEALQLTQSGDDLAVENTLKQAERGHHSYHAAVSLNKRYFKQLGSNPSNSQQLSLQIFLSATLAAEKHGTPGYLLLARSCFFLAEHHLKHSDKVKSNLNLITALYYLKIAKALEPASQESIHNAFFGAGVKEALILNDDLAFITIDQAIDRLSKIVDRLDFPPCSYFDLGLNVVDFVRRYEQRIDLWTEEQATFATPKH